jgi:hypothetical protein
MRSAPVVSSATLLAVVSLLSVAHADDHPMLDYLSVSIGGFANNNSASIRADGNVRDSGTRLDFSRDLGQGGTRTLPYLDVTWRPWDRHEFEFSYYHDSNDSSRYVSRTLDFNGNQLAAGAQLDSRFTLDAAAVNYRYWAWIGDQGAFGIFAGLQAYRFSLRLSGNAFAAANGNVVTTGATRSASVSSDLPDPSIGVSYRYQATSWARIVADAGFFKANVDNVDARIYNARLGAEFYPLDHFGIVTQYSFNKIEADVSQSKFGGNLDFKFRGFQLLLKLRF